jgi:GT2 family glycosyltransferase
MIARRTTVESVGLLDERFFLYGEDIEWCWRMRGAGWKVGVCSSAEARHLEASSANRTFGDEEARRRMVCGFHEAVKVVKGARYARRFARANALAMALEAANPRRSPARRDNARTAARLWRAAARGGCG